GCIVSYLKTAYTRFSYPGFRRIAEAGPSSRTHSSSGSSGVGDLSRFVLPDPTHPVPCPTASAVPTALRAGDDGERPIAASDLLFAAMLLSAPMGTPEAQPTPERWPVVR